MRTVCAVLASVTIAACSGAQPVPETSDPASTPLATSIVGPRSRSRTVRLSGTLEAARSTRVAAPELSGPSIRMTLTELVSNGVEVAAGDVVARFDTFDQVGQARQSAAQFEDLSYQVRQREAENLANVERRRMEMEQAEADLARALLEVRKQDILPAIEAEQNQIRAEKARAQLESLRITQPDQELADQAAVRILELQRDRQRGIYERAETNLEKLQVKAPISGMVALETRYSGGTAYRPQEGDQMTRNTALLRIFDPSRMLVRATVPETDGALLEPGREVKVLVDAYPDLELRAVFVSASPVAARTLSSPIKSFTAMFRLEDSDPRLMPDLSAAVVFDVYEEVAAATPGSPGL